MKKLLSVMLSGCMALGLCFGVNAEALEQEDPALVLLEDVKGTYEELFTVICSPEYDDLWLSNCTALVGEEMAEDAAAMLKAACTGTIYGEEAVEAYGDGSEGAQFDCFFTEGVHTLTFDGNVISGADENGEEVFSHTYVPAGEFSLGDMMDGYLYESEDADAGEFTYFLMMPDTPESTYHLEFRYGSDKDALAEYNVGPYAYWLAAGIPVDCGDQMIEDVIALFCEENLSGMGEEGAEAEAEVAAEGVEAVEEVAAEETEEAAEENAEVIEIGTLEELKAVADNLSGNYVLTADIDLSGEEWTPLGSFVPQATEGEGQELPDAAYAFTGTFDGQGHVISNLVINQPEMYCQGLFGCIADATIGNFTLENADVTAGMMGGGVVGYANSSEVHDVIVKGANIVAVSQEGFGEGMFAAVVGAGMGGQIVNCQAEANITVPDGYANVGIVGGGLEGTSAIGCTATGTVTAGNNCYGLGGISGCGFGSPEFTDDFAKDVTITAGEGTFWIGAITGYAGGYEDEAMGVAVTKFSGCKAENVSFELGEGSEEAGEIVGAGFYNEEYGKTVGAPFDAPTVFVIE